MFDSPSATLLVAEVRKALDTGLAPGFAQRVAANALGIAEREMEDGPGHAEAEHRRLADLLGSDDNLAALNARLTTAIRDGSIAADDAALLDHLILTTIAKLEIDQPAYPAFRAWKEGQ